jgi:hypothetical protein
LRRREYPLLSVLALLLTAPLVRAQATWPVECVGRLNPPSPPVTFSLPLEIDGGAALDRETPAPFVASLRVSPTFRLSGGKFELGPSVAVAYLNPKFEGLAGVRAAARVWKVSLPEAPIAGAFVSVDGLWGTRGGRQVLGTVRGDLGGVLIVSIFAGRDFGHHETLIGLRLGTDLTWLRNTRRQTDFRPPAPPPAVEEARSDYYGIVSSLAQRDALAAFFVPPPPAGAPSPSSPPRSRLAAAMREFFESQRSGRMPGSIEELIERLPALLAAAFPRSAIDEEIREAVGIAGSANVPVPTPPDDGKLAAAVVRGWCRATALVE